MANIDLRVVHSVSSATIFAVIQRRTDNLYFDISSSEFEAFSGGDNQVSLSEDASISGLYKDSIVLDAEWTDGDYDVVYYKDAITAANLIGGSEVSILDQEVIAGTALSALGVMNTTTTTGIDTEDPTPFSG